MKSVDIIPKSDIKQLIKVSKTSTKTIQHPHARYNQLGRISCIVCGVQIKSEFAWNAHILSKTHKQNENRSIQLPKRSFTEQSKSMPSQLVSQQQGNESNLPFKKSRIGENANIVNKESDQPKKLPEGFFDDKKIDKNPAEKTKSNQSNSKLPEGFFDDAYKDAKARNVPYKDKITEEMELFQKELVALEKHSEEIMEKESQDIVYKRDLVEINDQLKMWEKIKELETQKEQYEMLLKSKISTNLHRIKPEENEDKYQTNFHDNKFDNPISNSSAVGGSDDDDDDDINMDELDNFRTKNTS